ncbi:helix-turn-helix domain-containing protein [Sphingobacterium sp. LRF_L2]|uniref:helix-turn-helix domain-containing protein n=1 Tax=Sphingobacterium sp. LRF_L2 TaxID=3369421 RepID=UPI003F61257F
MTRNKNQLDFLLLNIGYATHNGDWNFKNIKSPFARIHVVVEGNAAIVYDGYRTSLQKNHMYLTPAYVHHGYECEGKFSLFYIHLYENPERTSSIFDSYSFPSEIVMDDLLWNLVKRLHETNPNRQLSFYDPQTYDTSSELIRNIALQISSPLAVETENEGIIKIILSRFLAQANDKTPDVDLRLLKVLDFIHENIQHAIAIDTLAQIAFLTKDHLIRLFKKQMNSTPGRYINQKKIEKAQLMMLVEDTSIQEIAFKLGFENVSYFNRLFKKLTGENPSAHKARLKAFQK